jgi:hypothetical protein
MINSMETEVLKLTKLKAPKKGEDRQRFLKKAFAALEELVGDNVEDKDEAERVWGLMNDATQKWYNLSLDRDGNGKDLPEFPDMGNDDDEVPAKQAKGAKAAPKAEAKGNGKEAKGNGKAAPKAETRATRKAKDEDEDDDAKPAKKAAGSEGYKGHRAGSRKEKMHKLFDNKGGKEKAREAVLAAGASDGLATGTLRSWMTKWGRAEA